jgi:predicted ArsR family transcriptional regulator
MPTTKPRSRATPKDLYPVLRVSTEYFLDGFGLLSRLHGDVVEGLIFMTMVHDQLAMRDDPPPTVRRLSRELGLPYETARRHAVALVLAGQCVEQDGGLVVPTRVQNGRRVSAFLHGIHGNAVRVLIDLTSIGVARYGRRSPRPPLQGKLTRQQLVIALAGTATLLAGLKALRDFWEGDIVQGLIYTAIWAANIRHLVNTSSAGTRDVLGDEHRLPVSALALSKSMRLPYETVRRHAQSLIDDGIVVRVGRGGLIVPEKAHRRRAAGALTAYQVTTDFLAALRQAGVKV